MLEFEAMGAWQAERLAAAVALDLPVDFIATDPRVQAALAALRPDARVLLGRLPLAPAAADGRAGGLARAGDARRVSAPIVLPANAGPVEHMVSGLIAEPDDEADVAPPARRSWPPTRSWRRGWRTARGRRSPTGRSDASEIAAALSSIARSPIRPSPRAGRTG